MQKSKLITLLRTFSKTEFNDFGKFIASPYHNKGRNFIPLYKALKKFYPSFGSPKLTEENIFKMIHPGQKLNEKLDSKKSSTLRSMISRMNELAEKFMVYDKMENGKLNYYYRSSLISAYQNKNLENRLLKELLSLTDDLEKEEKNFLYYIRKYKTNIALTELLINKKKFKKVYELTQHNFLNTFSYIFNSLSQYLNMIRAFRFNYNLKYHGEKLIMSFVETFDIKLFIKECPEDTFETKNIILINYHLIKSRIIGSEDENMLIALKIYYKIFNNLDRYNQFHIFMLLFTRCIGLSQANNLYIIKANELIDFVWGKGVVSYNEKQPINISIFTSGLLIKIGSGDLNLLKKYILQFKDKISVEYIKEVKYYSKSILNFTERKFEQCIKVLTVNDFKELYVLKTLKYCVIICSLYELAHLERAEFEIDSFEHFVRKNKNVSEIIKSEYMKFISSIKKLIKIKLGELKEPDIEKEKIMKTTQNSLWGWWFSEKVKELKKSA